MSQFTQSEAAPSQKPFLVSRFGGVDISDSSSGCDIRAQMMKNFRITPDGSLAKRCGYEKFATLPADIRGMRYGTAGGVTALWCVAGNGFYSCQANSAPALCGTLSTSAGEVGMFFFKGILYIMDGGENVTGGDYYRFDGENLTAVAGYVPLIANAAQPDQIGTNYEDVNLLTNTVIKRFQCRAGYYNYECNYTVSTVISALRYDSPTETGTPTVIAPANYTISGTRVVFSNVTMSAGASLTLTYTIVLPKIAQLKQKLISCRGFAQYGVNDNSHAFLFCGDDKNLVFPSECEKDGGFSAEYFPLNSPFRVGSENMAVTAAIRQYDKLMIFTEGETWSALQNESVNAGGTVQHTYSLEMLNDMYGACIRGGVRQYENVFYSLTSSGVYSWDTTDVEGERKAHRISDGIADSLTKSFLTDGITHCSQKLGEFWVGYGGGIWIYNISRSQWYYFDDVPADSFLSVGDKEAFSYGNIIYIFSDATYYDDGSLYSAVYKSNPFDLGVSLRKKTLHCVSLTLDTPKNDTVSLSVSADGRTASELDIKNSDGALKSGISLRCRITRLRFITAQFTSRSSGACEIKNAAFIYSQGALR